MRGSRVASRTKKATAPAPSEASGQVFTYPAPVRGLVARSKGEVAANGWGNNFLGMRKDEAVVLENYWPQEQGIVTRPGFDMQKVFTAFVPLSYLTYKGGTTSQLFGASSTQIRNITPPGYTEAVVATVTNGYYFSVNIATSGGNYLIAVNGTDSLLLYDGATFASITGVSVPAITGVTTSSLSHVSAHKGRVWFVEKNTMRLWYLPSGAIAGAATQFPMGAFFKKGGYIVATATWTVDGGAGPDDFFVIVTSEGEIAVYQGTDPASATTWGLVGVYSAGRPVLACPFLALGGDLLYLNEEGLFPISVFLQSKLVDSSFAVSFAVNTPFRYYVNSNRTDPGWSMVHSRQENMLLICYRATLVNETFAMNTLTKAWTIFSDWGNTSQALSTTFVTYNDTIYLSYGGSGAFGPIVFGQAYDDAAVSGSQIAITSIWQTSYQSLGSFASQPEMVKPFAKFVTGTTVSVSVTHRTDLQDEETGTTFTLNTEQLAPWQDIPADIGDYHSFELSTSSYVSSMFFSKLDILSKPAGIL